MITQKENVVSEITKKEINTAKKWRNEEYILDVADEENLTQNQRFTLVGLFMLRFPEETQKSYIREWANRLKKGSAYAHADTKTAKILKFLGWVE
jgi:hypothetical protein